MDKDNDSSMLAKMAGWTKAHVAAIRWRNHVLSKDPAHDFADDKLIRENIREDALEEPKGKGVSITLIMLVLLAIGISLFSVMVTSGNSDDHAMHVVTAKTLDLIKNHYELSDLIITCKNNLYTSGDYCRAIWIDGRGSKTNGRVSFPKDAHGHPTLMVKGSDGVFKEYKIVNDDKAPEE